MRKLMLVAVGMAALTATGLAVANGSDGTTASAVTGTFTATTVSSTSTKTCTTPAGKSIATTKATYRGTAAGDADLAGPITLEVRSVVNTTDGFGVVNGALRIDVVSGRDTTARFTAVWDHGKLAGFAAGHAREPRMALLGNLSAAFTTAGGFTDGRIGSSAGGAAVELAPGRCDSTPAQQRPEKSEARGTVSALSTTSITVGGLTCAIPSSLAARVASTVKLGDRAEIRCQLMNGQNTLVRLKKKR
jgi:hypothetical protein